MTQLRFQRVGHQYGDRWIFREVSFTLGTGECWGVVGRNGIGKTTLLRLLTGDDAPTEGEVWRHPETRFTLLRQNRGETSRESVGAAALEPFSALLDLERRIARETEELAGVDPGSEMGQKLLRDFDRHQEEFRRRGGYEMRARAHAALEGLGFPPESWEKPVHALSGGELGRLRLVQTLLAAPDVLLLDEPTNHLDLRSTEWLEEHLRGYPGTVVIVSHDRVFLERLVDHVLHLEEGTAYAYTGGFDSFLEQREERRLHQRKEWEKQQAHIARTEEFIRRNLAGQKTKQAKSRRTLLSRMERVARPGDDGASMALRFADARRSGGTVLTLEGVSCAYGERVLFAPFSAEVGRGERVAIVGPNGCGKSTMLRAIAGPGAFSGRIAPGAGVRVSYYRQDFTHLDPGQMVWQALSDAHPSLSMPQIRDHLARFLFRKDEIESRVGDLSGGEQARVALARATLERANLLLLDEPTNHLDIESRESLEEALQGFDGTVILISHDRALLDAVATRVWGFAGGSPAEVEDFEGTFSEWSERRGALRPAEQKGPAGGTQTARDERSSGAPGLSKNELRRRREEMEKLEARITQHESRISELEEELADPELYAPGIDPARARGLAEERDRLEQEMEEMMEKWARVGEELAGV